MNVYLEHSKAELFLLNIENGACAGYELNIDQQIEVRILY